MNPRAVAISSLLVPAFALLASTSSAAEFLIDDFESPDAPAPWVFSNGAEFPGATGALTSGPGHTGKGAHLVYDLSGGGQYVAATLALDVPIAAAQALSLWVRSPAGIRVTLRVTDETGQTLQVPAVRPLYAWDTGGWYRVVVPVGTSSSHWGGADDGVLHGSIRELSVLAADPVDPGAVGAVEFDDVSWLDDLSFSLDPEALVRAPVPAGSATLRDRLGANIHFTADDTALDALRDAGFGWVRMDLFWSAVEHGGVFDFGAYDGLVEGLEARGMRAHFILCYGHDDHASGAGWAPQTPDEIEAFGDYAQAAAEHFAGRPVQFEVWNEANLDGFWKPAADVNQYAPLAKEAIHRVHAGNPSALVSTTGTAGVDIDFIRACLAQGCADEADAIGVHPYRQGGPESAAEEIFLLREIIEGTVPDNPPVWQTEWGYSSVWYGDGHADESRHRQAILASREMLTNWALGFPLAVYYDVRDDGTDATDAEHNFGLLANDHSDKPAMVAVRALSEIAEGRKLVAFGVATPSTLHVLELEGPDDRAYAIWNSVEGVTSAVSLPEDATARDVFGEPIPVNPGELTVTVEEESGPVYVLVPRIAQMDAGASDAAEEASNSEAGTTDGATGGDSGGGVDDAGAVGAEDDDGGCSCSAPGTSLPGAGGWMAALCFGLLWARRHEGRR